MKQFPLRKEWRSAPTKYAPQLKTGLSPFSFSLVHSTVNGVYKEFREVVIATLEDKLIKMPSADGMAYHMREFSGVCDFPQVVGALDSCHFPVSPQKENTNDYYNYKCH